MRTKTKKPQIPESIQPYVGIHWGTPAPGDRISVDTPMHHCQRPYKRQNVYKYIAKIKGVDWNLFGYATALRRRSDGYTAVINGQHRINLVKLMLPAVTEVPAHIIEVDDSDFDIYGAELFNGNNGIVSKTVSNEELFYSLVQAQDPDALHMKKVLEKLNLSCGRVNVNPLHSPVVYANFQKCLKLGETATERAVLLMKSAFNGQVADDPLHGLVFLFSHPEYQDLSDSKKLVGQRFAQWFTTLGQSGLITLSDLKFRKYRQNPSWQKGIAYGLVNNFNRWLTTKSLPAVKIGTIKKIYESGFKKDDSVGYLI